MSGKTPQQMSRDNLTARGFLVSTVEAAKRFPDKKKRACEECGHQPEVSVKVDLFNFGDLLAFHPQSGRHIIVQSTTQPNHSTRVLKILGIMEAKLCLLAGVEVGVQSWAQDGKGERWRLREEWITLDQYKQAPHYPNTVAELVEIKRKAKKPDLPPGSTLALSTVDFEGIPF